MKQKANTDVKLSQYSESGAEQPFILTFYGWFICGRALQSARKTWSVNNGVH